MSDEWQWAFTQRATDQLSDLDPHAQDRIVSKLDEIVDSTPTGSSPHSSSPCQSNPAT